MDPDLVTVLLRNVARQLAVIPTEDLERHVRACEESLERHDSLGRLVDPTAWLKAADSGQAEDARNQQKIAEHLLAARQAIDTREAAAAGSRARGFTGA